MRALPVSLLLTASLGLSHCTTPDAKAPSVVASAHTSTSSGLSTGGVGPAPDQRPFPPHDVVSGDTVYAATLPVLRETDGVIALRVAVNPHAHTFA